MKKLLIVIRGSLKSAKTWFLTFIAVTEMRKNKHCLNTSQNQAKRCLQSSNTYLEMLTNPTCQAYGFQECIFRAVLVWDRSAKFNPPYKLPFHLHHRVILVHINWMSGLQVPLYRFVTTGPQHLLMLKATWQAVLLHWRLGELDYKHGVS